MFDDLLGNMKAQQEQLEIKLKTIKIVHEQDDILIEVNAAKEILNIEIAYQYFDKERREELEDLLVINLNRALELAEEKQHTESASLINNMMPGGLDGMFNG